MAKKAAKAVKQETDEQVVSIETDKKAITNLLPNSIEIVGLGLGRVIAINDRVLSAEKSIKINPIAQGFNWGYEGKEVSQLSLAVLAEYVPADIASAYYSVLRQQVFSKIPLNNFKMSLSLKAFMKDALNGELKKIDEEGISPYFDVEEFIIEEKK